MSSPPSKRTKMNSDPPDNRDGRGACESQDMFESSETAGESDSESEEIASWGGAPLASLPRGSPEGEVPPLPPPSPSASHTVTVRLPLQDSSLPCPFPAALRDVWDERHVRLPWSRENLYPVEQGGRKVLSSRWHLVVSALTQSTIATSQDLEQAVMSYNTRYRGRADWSFDGLHHLFSEVLEPEECDSFFLTTLPGMIKLLVDSPSILTSPLPLLRAGSAHSITLSQHQIAVLLVNAFFCTFPRRNVTKPNSEFSNYPMVNFNALFGKHPRRMAACLEKLKCLLCYFSQVTSSPRPGLVTFTRLMLHPRDLPDWEESSLPLSLLHLDSKGTIEEGGQGMLQADFANKFLGGGVLRSGLVQEEIRFTICPELMAGLVFTEALGDREAVLVTGAEQYCSYSGYGDTFSFTGRVRDRTERDSSGRRRTQLVAMDALRFGGNSSLQFRQDKIDRELAKALVAFSRGAGAQLEAVATGNWGCGAFGGDPRLKLVIQLLAASQAGRHMAYYTFGDPALVQEGAELWGALREAGVTVGDLYRAVCSFNHSGEERCGRSLFVWLESRLCGGAGELGGGGQATVRGAGRREEAGLENTGSGAAVFAGGQYHVVYDDDTDDSGDDSPTKALKNLASEFSHEPNTPRPLEELNPSVKKADHHAQGLLAVLDRMEKGELLDSEPITENLSNAIKSENVPPPSKAATVQKQAKMTDFFSK